MRSPRPATGTSLPALPIALAVRACGRQEVGDVSLGMFTTKDIKLVSFEDAIVTGVTCHVSHIEADLNLADPSDMAIACHQTGPITRAMIDQVAAGKSGATVFTQSKSVLFKSLKIRRIYDAKSQTLIYVAYSTKESSGSHKHAISTVPLWNTPAWQPPAGGD